MSEVAFCELTDGAIEAPIEQEGVWLSPEQIATLFERERSVITEHLRNIFRDEEPAADGKAYAWP
jgi:hypothetical protein